MRKPSILVPFSPAQDCLREQDVFVILRPESNGVEVESLLLRVIQQSPRFSQAVRLAYLANIPGDFIVQRHLMESRYHLKLAFARQGAELFTPYMEEAFRRHFGIPFEEARVIGSFEALEVLEMEEEELFNYWVDSRDLLRINGQTVKKVAGYFVVNYDMPALMHKNNRDTDIAVMILRSTLDAKGVVNLIGAMEKVLIERNIVNPHMPPSRIFHYSKGPFEQLLDSRGFLYTPELQPVSPVESSFGLYLREQGLPKRAIVKIIRHPIVRFRNEAGELAEEDLFSHTRMLSFPEAYQSLCRCCCQYLMG